MAGIDQRSDDRARRGRVQLLFATLLWLALSLCSLQLARIDLPDPQTRIDRAIAGRGLDLPTKSDRRARDPRAGTPGAVIVAEAVTSAPRPSPRVAPAGAEVSVAAQQRRSGAGLGFAARAPPARG